MVGVKAPADGKIEEYLVDNNEEVYEGQLLARIHNLSLESERQRAAEDAESAQNQLNALESQLIAARLEVSRARAEAARIKEDHSRLERAYQRQSMLHQQGATPRLTFEKTQKEFETAKIEMESTSARLKISEDRITELEQMIAAGRKSAEEKSARLENAEAHLQATQIHAPVDGIVISRLGEAGAEVSRGGEDVFQIATDLGNLQVVIEPEAAVLKKLQEGMRAEVYLSELGNEPLNGEIGQVTEDKAVVFFGNPNPLVRPGVTAQVRIRLID